MSDSRKVEEQADAAMQPLGVFSGRQFFLANEHFTRPGIYFWDGKTNVHVDDVVSGAVVPSEPLVKSIERILDESSAWIARPNHEVTRRVAVAAASAAFVAHADRTTPSPSPVGVDDVLVPRGPLQRVIDNLFAEHDGEWDSITTPDDVVAVCAALAAPQSPVPAGTRDDGIEAAAKTIRVFQDIVGWQPGESRNALLQEIEEKVRALKSQPAPAGRDSATISGEFHGLDNERQVFFYEQDFYVLSNFSSFRLKWCGVNFDTSEHAYHFQRFRPQFDEGSNDQRRLRGEIMNARSAHEAFRLAQDNKHLQRPDWNEIKVGVMRDLLRAKADQHEYVRRKLLATGDRELIENSWRDDFWGWGPNRDGQNMLGKLWMEVRAELRASKASAPSPSAGGDLHCSSADSQSKPDEETADEARVSMQITMQVFAERLNCKPDALEICEAIEKLKRKGARHATR